MSEAAIQKIKNLIKARKGYLTQYETKLQNFQTFITDDPDAGNDNYVASDITETIRNYKKKYTEMAELYEKLIDTLTDAAQITKYRRISPRKNQTTADT